MQRGKTIHKADAILCGDIHLREDTPVCRSKPEFEEAQWKKMDFLNKLQKEHDCPILCSGDLFHHWKPSPELLSKTLEHLPDEFYTVYGNHDLPYHNIDRMEECGIYTLWKGDNIGILHKHGHWGLTPEHAEGYESLEIKGLKIFVWHVYTYQGNPPWPGCIAPEGNRLLRKYPEYDLIVTGDNHIPFQNKYEGRLLVNTGSMMRQDADQIDYQPAVWLWDADANVAAPVYLPIAEGVVSREHLERVERRDGRIFAFIEKLKQQNEKHKLGMNFKENIHVRLNILRDVKQEVKDIIYKSMEV